MHSDALNPDTAIERRSDALITQAHEWGDLGDGIVHDRANRQPQGNFDQQRYRQNAQQPPLDEFRHLHILEIVRNCFLPETARPMLSKMASKRHVRSMYCSTNCSRRYSAQPPKQAELYVFYTENTDE